MSIFLDFDGTITAQDTIGELSKFALRVRATEGNDLQRDWDVVVKAYMDDYNGHVDGYHVPETDRRSVAAEVEFLRAMKTVELTSLERINACGVFRGIEEGKFREAGRELRESGVVRVRNGFAAFVERVLEDGFRVYVVSVNWSTAFIEGVLDEPKIEIIANHVREDGAVVGPEILNPGGEIGEMRNLTNSCDKLDVMRTILEREGHDLSNSWYFGDSITDLECLLHASFGIVVSDKEDSKLLETLERIGETVPHIKDLGNSDKEQKLAWASNYEGVIRDMPSKFR